MMQHGCALNTSPEIFYLDHICPLASFLQIPLIVTEEKNAILSQKYYPEVSVQYWPDLYSRLTELSNRFDGLVGCDYWMPNQKHLFKLLSQKEMRLVFCPHGQSDKGYGAPSLAPYALQEEVLLYGDLMKEMLIELKLWDSIAKPVFIGNFRLRYYQKYQERLRLQAENEIFSSLPRRNRNLLYAPTWKDGDGSTSFFDMFEKLLKETPSDWNFIVKIHPLLPSRDPALFYRLSAWEEKRSNYILVSEFPLVYPILEKIDAYLGDYSSIGYDALFFQKPMFFLKQPNLPPARLHSCGKILDRSENLFQSIEQGLSKADMFLSLQASLYKKAFDSVEGLSGLG